MTITRIPFVLNITVSSGVVGQEIYLYNRNTQESMIIPSSTATKTVADCGNFASGYSNGDVIELSSGNGLTGGTTVTIDISKGGDTASWTATTYATPTIISM